MMISTRGRYALRVMLDLAEQNSDGYIPMKSVAERQELSLKYIERIMPILSKNKLVEGIHGKGGGYRLTRKPEKYTVGEILRLVEGGFAPVSCLECGYEPCERVEQCRTISMWKNLHSMIDEYFDGITLKDLLNDPSSNLSGIDISFLDSSL